MGGNEIYTIGREFGSFGKQVGEILAKKLGINLYDKELLQIASKESGYCQDIFENNDEKPTSSFLYSLVVDTCSGGSFTSTPFLDMPLNQKVFLAQFETIKKIASQESCVIVGRCADYALENNKNCINIFIRAEMDDKINRISQRLDLTSNKARELILKTDKQRASYYNYYTNKKWGDSRSYDLCINTSKISVEDAADLIIQYRNMVKK